MIWQKLSKSDKRAIRMEMLSQAEEILAGMYPSRAQLKAAARTMVDKALAKERKRYEEDDADEDSDEGSYARNGGEDSRQVQ